MNLADLFTGGKSSEAEDAIKAQLDKLNAVQTPTAESLTLPQLQQFVSAGIMTPEEAKSYLAGDTAYSGLTADNSGLDTEMQAIGKLQDIVNSGGADAEEQANIQGILNTLGTTERGDREAIVTQNARQGIANSGLTMAAKLAAEQNDATNANTNALQTGASEEARNLEAIKELGGIGGQVQGQQYTAGANKASAADAISKFNAQQEQDISKVNTTAANAAKAANLSNAQDISNKNTIGAQQQEASVPAAQQKAYEDALGKATAGMGGAEALANAKSTSGQQSAGILGGLLGTAGTVGAAYLTGNPYAALASKLATPSSNVDTSASGGVATGATGGRMTPAGIEPPINMTDGGPVPGKAMVPGDSAKNDTQLAALSPDEIVLPRTVAKPAMSGNMSPVMDFLRSLPKPQEKPSIHPKAVLDTLRALNAHHMGAAA